ncbi:ribonuclease III [Candidatus Proelusimicrobium excrementi]|uniref:ribonuclease III n=1 Tax=Candidatus Proelusimicrobium excrementi TaxID=3416222 RepID=UPI003C898F5D|nr:ribonuclease III [Elusimicrobiaceae bacterium]
MFSDLEKVLNYTFRDKNILREALSHKSYAAEFRHNKDNERLEFLGDSVLGLVVAAYLYKLLDAKEEGVLSKIKANLVSRRNLYFWGQNLKLGEYMFLGQGEIASGGRQRQSILSNAMEAVVGAVYLDGGFDAAKDLILKWLETQKIEADGGDYKSVLQEYLQKRGKSAPEYDVVSTVGPEHDKIFTVRVTLLGRELGRGKGHNKKAAQQAAAKEALAYYNALGKK